MHKAYAPLLALGAIRDEYEVQARDFVQSVIDAGASEEDLERLVALSVKHIVARRASLAQSGVNGNA